MAAFENDLEIERNLKPVLNGKAKISVEMVDQAPELGEFSGGSKCSSDIRDSYIYYGGFFLFYCFCGMDGFCYI